MTSAPSLCLAAFLLAALGASSAWDTSNIWFPDPNNPVFYNMTFYQEAAKAVQRATSQPPTNDQRQQARPSGNEQRPQAQPSRDDQRPPSVPSRNNQRPQSQPSRNNQRPQSQPSRNNQRPSSEPSRNELSVTATAARPTESERTKPTWNRMFSRVNPNQQGGNTFNVQDQHDKRNAGSFQGTPVGFRSAPEDAAARTMDEYNRQSSGNRLERGEYEYQPRPVFRSIAETTMPEYNQGMRQTGSGRGWSGRAPTGNEATNTVEGDIISDIETTSRSSGPSKCVWAIISCCKPASTEIRYMCFEALGCHGAFWDNNPCSKAMTRAAVQSTAAFYKVPIVDQ